jgi:hypothetical protein
MLRHLQRRGGLAVASQTPFSVLGVFSHVLASGGGENQPANTFLPSPCTHISHSDIRTPMCSRGFSLSTCQPIVTYTLPMVAS